LHLIWWTKRKLALCPDVRGTDLRTASPLPVTRQIELGQWSILMMRLLFISDVASCTPGDDGIHELAGLAEAAAEQTQTPSPLRLRRWVRREGLPLFDAALSAERYEELAAELRGEAAADG